ncbi:MAG: ATP-binding cassette domain-containing protein [Thermoanaerobaculia bacterium]
MTLRVRTEDLRKVYSSAPPVAVGGRGPGLTIGFRAARRPAVKTQVLALDGLTLAVAPGEMFGLLGPNGAGKSTTVGVLTTRVRPDAGRAWIGDHDVWKDPVAVKRVIGVVPQRPNLDFALTAREILLFHGAYFGMPAADRARRSTELIERFQLADRADSLVVGFSGGMMQRLSIARAMMHDPQVLFLDEPSAGLDPQTRLLLWEILRDYNAQGKTVLLATHNMEEADTLCPRIAIIDHGRVIASGPPEELKRAIPGGYLVRLQLGARPPELLEALGRLPGVTEVRPSDGAGVDLYADRGGPLIPEAVDAALRLGVEVSDVHVSEPSLENLFLHHTGRSLRD